MKLTCLLLVELKLEYAIISSSLPSSAVPSILIKPGLELLIAEPPMFVPVDDPEPPWNPLFSAISQLVSVELNPDAS